MKKLLNKIRRNKNKTEQSGRITADTIAEHRERILAGGRRFKYPMQYARHKLVFNTVIISVAAIILMLVVGWWQLYVVQNTSDFMYRVTRVVPVSVASIDGESVRYSDYLLKYRGSIHYLREIENVNFSSEDGQRQADFVRSQELNDTMADTYAAKLARERGIVVTNEELAQVLQQQRLSGSGEQSEAAYYTTIRDYYGWSAEEYREITRTKLLRQKVAFAIDDQSRDASARASSLISGGETDLQEVVEAINGTENVNAVYAAPGFLPRTNQDGGVTAAAAALEEGEISGAVQSSNGAGYFFIKLIEKGDTQVRYQYIQIPVNALTGQLNEILDDADRARVHIEVPDPAEQTQP
jgi:hypothetical protein